MTYSAPTASVIGLGAMGSALARAFLNHGYIVTCWNRTTSKAAPLVAYGARAATSATDCVQASPLVITCVTDHKAYQSIISSITPSASKGRLLVDFTTGSPSQIFSSRQLATVTFEFSTYLHGAMMAMPVAVGQADAVSFYSGVPEDTFNPVRTTLEALGTVVYLDEDPASSAEQDAILLNTFYSLVSGFLQSMALLKTTKRHQSGALNAESFTKETLSPFVQIAMRVLEESSRQIDCQDYVAKGDGASMGLHLIALDNVAHTNEERGLSSFALRPMRKLIESRLRRGGDDEELSAGVEEV